MISLQRSIGAQKFKFGLKTAAIIMTQNFGKKLMMSLENQSIEIRYEKIAFTSSDLAMTDIGMPSEGH